jgi:hypothetical protein
VGTELFAGKPAPTGFAASGGELNPKGIQVLFSATLGSIFTGTKYRLSAVDLMAAYSHSQGHTKVQPARL